MLKREYALYVDPSSSSHVGKVINGRYRLISSLGRGSLGEVYLADDIRQRRQVAIKVFDGTQIGQEEFKSQFRERTEIVASLKHPNLISIIDSGDGEIPFIVTEYLGGGTLRSMLEKSSSLTPSQAVVVGIEISKVLDYGHKRGIIRYDLRPEKIFFDVEGEIKLSDFGFLSVTPEHIEIGVNRYASPEQTDKETPSTASDIYSLALILYEAVVGPEKFELVTQNDRNQEITLSEAIFGSLANPITLALSCEPSSRPDAESFHNMLLEASKDLSRPQPLPVNSGLHTSVVSSAVGQQEDEHLSSRIAFRQKVKGVFRFIGSRLKRWIWLLAMAALVAGIITVVYTTSDEEVINIREVPDAIGLTPETFINEVNEFWNLEEALTRKDGSDSGVILKTVPPTGDLLQEGETITYFVSQGAELRDIPLGLAGMTIQDAESSLLGAKLTLGKLTQQPSEDIAIGLVIGSSSLVSEMPTGSSVDLFISSGPELRTVPDNLVGNSFEEAETLIVLAGLKVLSLQIYDPEIPEGIIIATNPSSGKELLRDSFVELTVSLGPEISQ